MKKKKSIGFSKSLVFLTFLFIFGFLSLARAYGVDFENLGFNLVCLDVTRIGGHSVKLSSANVFLPGTDVYIVECISTTAAAGTFGISACTTGDPVVDGQLGWSINEEGGRTLTVFDILARDYQYSRPKFRRPDAPDPGTLVQPLTADEKGSIGEIFWESVTVPSTGHSFWGLTFNSGAEGTGRSTLQLGKWYPSSSQTECISLRWDPYGRVFDSQSLEPISGVNVLLATKKDDNPAGMPTPVILPVLRNPQKTREDGTFSFIVPNGSYFLQPSKSGFIFPGPTATPDPNSPGPTATPHLHPNYTEAYFDLYYGEKIVQRSVVQHRDLPLISTGEPFSSPAVIMDYSSILDKQENKYLIEGQVSHPLSRVQVVSSDGGTVFGEVSESSQFGIFQVKIDASIPGIETMGLKVTKKDLTDPLVMLPGERSIKFLEGIYNRLFPFVFGQSKSSQVEIQPIFNYLEGYAYGASGNPEPNAKVGIYLSFSQKPYFETKADSNGFFKISSEYLPAIPYKVKITSSIGTNATYEPSQFAALNKEYVEKNKISYSTFQLGPGSPAVAKTTGPADGAGQNNPADNQEEPGSEPRSEPAAIINRIIPGGNNATKVLFILAIIGLLGGGFYLLIIKVKISKKEPVDQSFPEDSSENSTLDSQGKM